MRNVPPGRVEYEQRQGWIATGTILAIMIPLIVCMLFAYMHIKKKNKQDKTDGSWHYFPTKLRMSLSRKKSGAESLFTPDKKNKLVYDKVYRTNEPVPGRPPVDFSEREPDLSSIEDPQISTFVENTLANVPKSGSEESSDDDDFFPNVERNIATSSSSLESSIADKNPRKARKSSGKSPSRSAHSSKTPSTKIDSSEEELVPPPPSSSQFEKSISLPENVEPTVSSPKSSKASVTSDSSKAYQSLSSSPTPDFAKPERFKRTSSSDRSDFSEGLTSPQRAAPPVRPPPPRFPAPQPKSLNSSVRSDSSRGEGSSSSSDPSSGRSGNVSGGSKASKGSAIQTSI